MSALEELRRIVRMSLGQFDNEVCRTDVERLIGQLGQARVERDVVEVAAQALGVIPQGARCRHGVVLPFLQSVANLHGKVPGRADSYAEMRRQLHDTLSTTRGPS